MGRLKRKKTTGQKQSAATTADKSAMAEAAGTSAPAAVAEKAVAETGTRAKKSAVVKRSSKPLKVAGAKKQPNVIDKSLQFLREVKVELKKVTWPSRKQTIGSTIVVLILAMIISLFLGVVDMGLSGLIRVILN